MSLSKQLRPDVVLINEKRRMSIEAEASGVDYSVVMKSIAPAQPPNDFISQRAPPGRFLYYQRLSHFFRDATKYYETLLGNPVGERDGVWTSNKLYESVHGGGGEARVIDSEVNVRM